MATATLQCRACFSRTRALPGAADRPKKVIVFECKSILPARLVRNSSFFFLEGAKEKDKKKIIKLSSRDLPNIPLLEALDWDLGSVYKRVIAFYLNFPSLA